MRCWICYTITSKYILLPEKEDDFILPKNKETYEVKHIEPFVFLYYIYQRVIVNFIIVMTNIILDQYY